MGFCDGCVKYLLFFFNLVFTIIGLALIIVGAVLLNGTTYFSDVVKDIGVNLKTPEIFMIIIGILIFITAGLGCCGAIRENRCMLLTYAIFLLAIFILQLAVGIYVLTHKPDLKQAMEEGLSKEFKRSMTNSEARKLFQLMEMNMECCGVRGYTDYALNLTPVPGSCCEDKSDCRIRPSTYWNKGCAPALIDFIEESGEVLGGVAVGCSIVEVVGAIFALWLASKVK